MAKPTMALDELLQDEAGLKQFRERSARLIAERSQKLEKLERSKPMTDADRIMTSTLTPSEKTDLRVAIYRRKQLGAWPSHADIPSVGVPICNRSTPN